MQYFHSPKLFLREPLPISRPFSTDFQSAITTVSTARMAADVALG
jgi:hypothetical protein